ncbi:hypothetical protein [Paenirhodobacter sp.]|uniref:hypothetical protein n=1 Tax=Paenirhodobacter sp. TaxID=1965326 RepID=UPI003B50EA81
MHEAFLTTTTSEGLSALGTREQRSYELLSETLRERLGPDLAALLAEPVATDLGDRSDWYAAVPGRARRLTDLPAPAQAAARAVLSEQIAQVEALAESLAAGGGAEALRLADALRHAMQVPGDSHIFVVERAGAAPQPVLVNWAWVRDDRRAVRGTLTGSMAPPPPPPQPPPPRVTPAAAPEPRPAPVLAERAAPSGLWWLLRAGWLLLALLIAWMIWLLIPACGLRGLFAPGDCPGAAVVAAAAPAERSVLEDEIARIEREITLADNACQPLPPPPAPQPAPAPEPPQDTGMLDRLDRAGAQRGRLAFSLAWDTPADLDLWITCPAGATISYKQDHACGGVLDVDSNAAGTRLRRDPVENVFFAEPPPGAYVIRVDFFGRNGDAPQQPFRVMIRDGEQVTLREGVVALGSGGRRQWMMTYNYTGN